MVKLVTYDLRKPGQDYTAVHDAIKSCGEWWHYLESVWLVDSYMTAGQIAEKVRWHIDTNDRLLVIGVTGDSAGCYRRMLGIGSMLGCGKWHKHFKTENRNVKERSLCSEA